MRTIPFFWLLLFLLGSASQVQAQELRTVLLEQLRNSHSNKHWHVPMQQAVAGLTAKQANWKDQSGNHSIGELVSHLIFWNERNLMAFKGNTPPAFDGNNKATFQRFDPKEWQSAVQKLDSIQLQLEQVVQEATDQQLQEWSSTIASLCTHNAYHTGQILYIRKQKGWWNDAQGVK